jgi:RNA polymerase sigma factor (sigma-70 family)
MMSTSEDPSTRERFERLYVETRVGILGYVLRRASSPSDASDVLAETYLIAWRKIDDIPSDEKARLWLYGVARHVLSNHHRHERVEQNLGATLRADLSREAAEFRTQQEAPFGEAIAASLDALGPDDREIMELSAWEGLTPTEIAEVIGVKPGAVRVRLHRLRGVLRSDLIKAGYPRPGQVGRAG